MPNNLTQTPSTADRVFQAIDGTELRRIILAEIERVIDLDPKFKRHLTYPIFSFSFNIAISAYPMEPAEFKVVGKYKRVVPGAELPPDDTPFDIIKVAGELNVDAPAEGGLAPDEARERAGIPVTTPTRASVGKSGQIVVDQASMPPTPILDDAAVLASGTPSPNQMERLRHERAGGNTGQPKNRPEASPRFARSVDLANNAAPDGARVDDNIGTRK